jgi:hypothetical protein
MHRSSMSWDEIAELQGVSRKQVQRIVQGSRWAHLHPTRRPELYEEGAQVTFTAEQVDAAWNAAHEAFVDALKTRPRYVTGP